MAAPWHDSSERSAGSPLSGDIGARVAAIVHAAEREALAAERAIADQRRSAEEEVQRYLAATRLHVDAETAARAARLEALSTAARRLAAELSDATTALTHELRRADEEAAAALPRTPWPAVPAVEHAPGAPMAASPPPVAQPPAPPPPAEPTWTRNDPVAEPTWTPAETANGTAHESHEPLAAAQHDDDSVGGGVPGAEVPSAARLVAIEMAVSGSSRADVERHLRERLGTSDPQELLDDVFGTASHAGSTLAWGQP